MLRSSSPPTAIQGRRHKTQRGSKSVTSVSAEVGKLAQKAEIVLRWPAWYQPTAQDAQNKAETLRTHTDAGHMSRETAVKAIAADYDIEDVPGELTKIEKEEAARNAAAQK